MTGQEPTFDSVTTQPGMGRWLWPSGFALGFYVVSVFAQAISDTAFGIMRIGDYNVWIIAQIMVIGIGVIAGIDYNRRKWLANVIQHLIGVDLQNKDLTSPQTRR